MSYYFDADSFTDFPAFFDEIITDHYFEFKRLYGHLHYVESWEYEREIEYNGQAYDLINSLVQICINQLSLYSLTGYHATRVLNINSIIDNGIIKSERPSIDGRLGEMLFEVGFPEKIVNSTIIDCAKYWDRDSNRRGTIHLFSSKTVLHLYCKFCDCVGGEIVDFVTRDLSAEYPYNTLRELGSPIAIKFRYNFKDLDALGKEKVAFCLFRSALVKRLFSTKSIPEFDTWIYRSIPPNDILSILNM